MTETDRRQRLITSTPHLSPEEVASRSFGTGFRGYSEAEVRGFLKRVSEQLAAGRERERELEAAVDALEDQLRQPRPLDEKDLLDALGEETARLLRSAREAGENIRKKSEEQATRMLEEATADAHRMRTEAEEVLTLRTQEAEARVAEIMTAAEARATELGDAATAESEATTEAARNQGREMLDEAKSARERVLGDLVRRRALLQAQIEVLRGGRDHLLDAYRTVKRTFLEATEALGEVEARAAAERPTTTAAPLDIAAEIAAEIEALDAGEADDFDGQDHMIVDLVEAESRADKDVDRDNGTDRDDNDRTTGALADVDSLFARLRSNHDEPHAAVATAPPATAATDEAGAGDSLPTDNEPTVTASEWREVRARAIDPLLGPLLKKAKRVAQDDQNALLDAVRRHKGRPAAAQVLPGLDASLESWGNLLRDAVEEAYAAGSEAAGTQGRDVDDALVREAADALVSPLRLRITVAIDSGEAGDTGGLVERIGARYREWKNQSLEPALAEVLALAWSRGVYDAVPDGGVLWWVPFEEGRCSDCDDNALEPTVKGKDFPTGQSLPPAHPGCRCLLAPAEILNAPT
jgi:DivIVA domain-containing protein